MELELVGSLLARPDYELELRYRLTINLYLHFHSSPF